MDNVSSIRFDFEIIRKPKKQSKNIFEFAARLYIKYNDEIFLKIEEVCIVDLIYKLSLYNSNLIVYEFVPMDSEDRVLIFKNIDSDNVELTSEWTNNKIVVKQNEVLRSIELLKSNFEKSLKVKIDKYYK